MQKNAGRTARAGPGNNRENPTHARRRRPAGTQDRTLRQPDFLIRPDHAVPEQGAQQHHVEHDRAGQASRSLAGHLAGKRRRTAEQFSGSGKQLAGRHNPHFHGDWEFIGHCDYFIKDAFVYMLIG
jgi:hypothetical protein